MSHARAYAKLNLGLVVGPRRDDGKHEVVTVLMRIDLHDDIALDRSERLEVEGFPDETIARASLESLARAAGVEPRWRLRITKRIPVAAGLGGGSSDAAVALELANATLAEPLSASGLHDVASRVGADVPFFLRSGPQLATGDGAELERVRLPLDFHVVLVLPDGHLKESTRSVYDAFDARNGGSGYEARAERFRQALTVVKAPRDLAGLPPNDLASSPIADELIELGAFRADVTGAGPTVYGLFEDRDAAEGAGRQLETRGRTLLVRPATQV